MLSKNLFISSLIISSILLLNSLPVFASNLIQRKNVEIQNSTNTQSQEKNAKTRLNITKIEYEKPNNLQNSWDKIQQIIQNNETTLTFDSQIILSKIRFNLPIPITKNDNLEAIIHKNKEIRNSVLETLLKQKNGEKDFLESEVFDMSAQNIENLQEQMTILANLDTLELESSKNQNYNPQNLFAKSLAITTTKQSDDKNIDQIASSNSVEVEKIDLTNADKNHKIDQNLRSKILLMSGIIAKKTDKLIQIQSQNAKLSESNSAPSEEIQSSFSSSSLAVLPEITLSRSNSSSSQISASPVVPKIKDLLEINENENSNNPNQKEILVTQNLIQQSNLENLPNTNSEVIKNSTQNSNQELDQNKIDKKPQKITKITKFTYKNPFFISQKEQEVRNQEIETEKQKALTHNRKFKQYYSQNDYQKMLDSNTVPDPKIYPYIIIDEKGKEIDQKNLPKLKDKTGWLDSILSLGSVETAARGLNNSVVPLLIYSWTNPNLTLDLPNGNTNNGTQFGLYGRHGGWNQTFSFDNNSNQIRINGANKCLEVSAGNFSNGTRIQIWDCHGGSNQKWYFDGLRLKPLYNQNFCLEQNAGVTEGTRINLWSCNGNNNQVWVAGNNDFGTYNFMTIAATNQGSISGIATGHAFAAILDSSYNVLNTFSAWPGDKDNESINNNNKTNNIAENDGIWVDKDYDWVRAYNPYTYGYRERISYISKKYSDYFRFGNGYRINYINQTKDYNYFFFSCANQASDVWNHGVDLYLVANKVDYTNLPTNIYNSL